MGDFLHITESAALWQQILLLYLGIINVTAFVVYGVDKHYARRNKWRIPEKRLLVFAAAGGALGAFVGMRVFRHKTQKVKFRITVPLFLVIYTAAVLYLMFL